MSSKIIGVVGSLSRPSKTCTLVEAAVTRAAARFDLSGAVFDLSDIGPSLGQAGKLSELSAFSKAAVDAILSADALVIASPVYKGSYSGLFKHLFDLLDPSSLAGKPTLLAATGGGDRHALIIEHQLRPLFGFFEAQTLATGVYASDTDFTAGQPVAPALLARLDRAVDQFAPWFARRRTAQAQMPGNIAAA